PNSLACSEPWIAASPISIYAIGSRQTFFIICLPSGELPRRFLVHSCKCWEAGGSGASSIFVRGSRRRPRSTFAVRVICLQQRAPICSLDKAIIQPMASRQAAKIPSQGQLCWKRDKKSEDRTCFLTPAPLVFRRQGPSATLDETLSLDHPYSI